MFHHLKSSCMCWRLPCGVGISKWWNIFIWKLQQAIDLDKSFWMEADEFHYTGNNSSNMSSHPSGLFPGNILTLMVSQLQELTESKMRIPLSWNRTQGIYWHKTAKKNGAGINFWNIVDMTRLLFGRFLQVGNFDFHVSPDNEWEEC